MQRKLFEVSFSIDLTGSDEEVQGQMDAMYADLKALGIIPDEPIEIDAPVLS